MFGPKDFEGFGVDVRFSQCDQLSTVNQLGTRVDMDHVARILGRWALFSQGHIGFV